MESQQISVIINKDYEFAPMQELLKAIGLQVEESLPEDRAVIGNIYFTKVSLVGRIKGVDAVISGHIKEILKAQTKALETPSLTKSKPTIKPNTNEQRKEA